MALTCAEIEERYRKADQALFDLTTGVATIRGVRYGEKEVQYNRSRTDIAALTRLVSYLADQLAACQGVARTKRQAIGIIPI